MMAREERKRKSEEHQKVMDCKTKTNGLQGENEKGKEGEEKKVKRKSRWD